MHDDPVVANIADALRLYVQRWPRAVDSERGIREWWLADVQPPPTPQQVAKALRLLAREGTVIRHRLADGSDVWRSGGPA